MPLREYLLQALGREQIDLGERQYARKLGQPGVVRAQLALDRYVVCERIRPLTGRQLWGDIEHVHEQPGALDMGEELVPEARAGAGALDQPGDVRDDQLPALQLVFEHPQDRRERRERITRDLWRRAGQSRQQRGLARIRHADEADVREQPQAQLDPALLAGQPALGEARRLTRRGREGLVPAPAGAASRNSRALSVRGQLAAAAFQVVVILATGLGSGRHPDLKRPPIGAMTQRALAVASSPRPVVRLAPESAQVAQRLVADQDDVPPAPAIAAVGAAARHMRLATEARATVAPRTGPHVDLRAVLHRRRLPVSLAAYASASPRDRPPPAPR